MDLGMFHQGDLNSGITLAIQERKVVACLIRSDDDDWSEVWEDYWLANKSQPTDMISSDTPPLGLVVAEKAVLLRLYYGSKEAGFLNAFCPITKAPTLVVIHNGKVLEKLEGGIGRAEFEGRLLRAVGFDEYGVDRTVRPEDVLFDQDEEEELMDDIGGHHAAPDVNGVAEEGSPQQQTPDTTASTSQQPTQPLSQPSSNVREMLNERAQRLESERLKEAAEKAERTARAIARRKEAEEAGAAHTNKGKQRATTEQSEEQRARDAWVYQQKKRKDEARKERERILAQIESDKQERKAQAQRRKEAESVGGGGASSEMASSSIATALPARTTHGSCMLVIRLFDGSSIRAKFSSSASIATEVRTWVNEAAPDGGADIPYNFRQILAPKPSRTIEVSEEHQSLQELGLVPNATLVLVPVAGATNAYASAGGGYLGSAWNAWYYLTSTAHGVLGSVWSYVPGFGGATNGLYMGGTGDQQETSNIEGARMAGSDTANPGGGPSGGVLGIRVKTMADQQRVDRERVQRAAEFYNGNSSAFEGRKDDEDEG